jgi:hypothetical protein
MLQQRWKDLEAIQTSDCNRSPANSGNTIQTSVHVYIIQTSISRNSWKVYDKRKLKMKLLYLIWFLQVATKRIRIEVWSTYTEMSVGNQQKYFGTVLGVDTIPQFRVMATDLDFMVYFKRYSNPLQRGATLCLNYHFFPSTVLLKCFERMRDLFR